MRKSLVHSRLKAGIQTIVAIGLVLATATAAQALPIFARRYQTTCTTCHVVVPKLNPFGIAFRNNGYRIPINDERFIKTPDVPLGAPGWKQLWPNSVWPGSISSVPPVAMRVAAEATVRPSDPIHLNFNFPTGLNLYFAGSEGAGISYFSTVFISGAGAVALDRAYAQFRLTPDTPGQNLLVFKVGRIETRAEPFSGTFRRTTSQQMNVSDFRTVTGGFGLRDHDAGLELWGAATGPGNRGGLEYAVGVVQGTAGRAENNNAKDVYAAASYKLSGLGVVGSREESADTDVADPQSERSLTIGGFAYSGRSPTATPGATENRFARTGVKLDGWIGKLNAYGAIARGTDRMLGVAPQTIRTTAIMAQADYMLLPWVMPTLRIEKTLFSHRPDVVLFVPAASMLLRANVRVLTEAHVFTDVRAADGMRGNGNEWLVRLEFTF